MKHYIRRHYPARPVEPHEYAAWRAVLELAQRNQWYLGPDDGADDERAREAAEDRVDALAKETALD